ncbi:MAG: hypothetical protein EOP45_16845 [Sphingobacteriaceae bacterium]|nr:MAG: hypothetical protein EOP45_16845 [Sphingobacteriaceae bacterium]
MISREKISELLKKTTFNREVTVMGWVRTFRNNQFIALNDGSAMANIQVVVDFANTDETILKRITTGAAIRATGMLVESVGKGNTTTALRPTGAYEVRALIQSQYEGVLKNHDMIRDLRNQYASRA